MKRQMADCASRPRARTQWCRQIDAHSPKSLGNQRPVRASLDYCTKAFDPYSQPVLGVAEIPRYHNGAQSFPGPILTAEEAFLANDQKGLVFANIAQEVAHQWVPHRGRFILQMRRLFAVEWPCRPTLSPILETTRYLLRCF